MLPDRILHELGQADALGRRLDFGPLVELVIQPKRLLHDRNLSQLRSGCKDSHARQRVLLRLTDFNIGLHFSS